MVWGVEIGEFGGKSANEVANACVLAAYHGDDDGRAVHLMGPLAKKVLRIAPPLKLCTETEARDRPGALRASRPSSGSSADRPRPKASRAEGARPRSVRTDGSWTTTSRSGPSPCRGRD